VVLLRVVLWCTMADLVSRREAAELLGITVHGIRYLRKRGKLTFLRDGRGRVWASRTDVKNLRCQRERLSA
jgi:excisionase family DNA binding protein